MRLDKVLRAVLMLFFPELVDNVDELVGIKVTQTVIVEGMSVVIPGTKLLDEH